MGTGGDQEWVGQCRGGGGDRQQAPGGAGQTEFGHRDIETKNCAMAVHTAAKRGSVALAGTPLVPPNEKTLISPIASFASQASVVSTSDGDASISFNVSIASFSPLLSTFGITRGFDRAGRKGRHSSLAQSLHFSTTDQGRYSRSINCYISGYQFPYTCQFLWISKEGA